MPHHGVARLSAAAPGNLGDIPYLSLLYLFVLRHLTIFLFSNSEARRLALWLPVGLAIF